MAAPPPPSHYSAVNSTAGWEWLNKCFIVSVFRLSYICVRYLFKISKYMNNFISGGNYFCFTGLCGLIVMSKLFKKTRHISKKKN